MNVTLKRLQGPMSLSIDRIISQLQDNMQTALNQVSNSVSTPSSSGAVSVIGTNPVNYTPTFTSFGTVSGVSFFWQRVGAQLKLNGQFTTGTTTASVAKVSLPSGLSADGTFYNGTRNWIVGTIWRDAGHQTPLGAVINPSDLSNLQFTDPFSNLNSVNGTSFNNTELEDIECWINISGWKVNS